MTTDHDPVDAEKPLARGVRAGDLDLVRSQIAAGVEPHDALWVAVWPTTDALPANAVAILTALLDAGADPNQAWDGESALYLAAKHPALLRVLLERGADPNRATANGETPLSFCADWGHIESVRVLLAGGADPNHVMPVLGWPILFVAAAQGAVAILDALLDAGADPLHENARGQTALAVALDHRQTECAARLIDRVPAIAGRGTVDLVAAARQIPDDALANRIAAARSGSAVRSS